MKNAGLAVSGDRVLGGGWGGFADTLLSSTPRSVRQLHLPGLRSARGLNFPRSLLP